MQQELTTCAALPPEDIRVDDFITQMQQVFELPSFFWSLDSNLCAPEHPVRYVRTPCHSGLPARVRSVCLPFILVDLVTGESASWDLRQCQVGRLSPVHARLVWKQFKSVRKKKRKHLKKRNRKKR